MFELKFKDERAKTRKVLIEKADYINEAYEASKNYIEARGLDEGGILALYQSPVQEVFPRKEEEKEGKWYTITLKTNDEKPTKHIVVIEAKSADRSLIRAKEIMEQGYDMEPVSTKESGLQDVIDATQYRVYDSKN